MNLLFRNLFIICLLMVGLVVQAQPKYTLYLTFDDGPLEGSENIIEAITKDGVKINVFIVGEHVSVNPRMRAYYELYKKSSLVEEGNHSYTHANNQYKLYYSNPEGVLFDMVRNTDSLHFSNRLARLPGRNMWRFPNGRRRDDVVLGSEAADLVAQKGMVLFGWDVEWQHDNTGTPIQSVADMVKQINKQLRKGKTFTPGHLVLLSHDEMFRNTYEESELKQLLDILRATGNYRIEHLSRYPFR